MTILVNNAGILYTGYFNDVIADQVREGTIVNTFPYVLLTRALLPNLKQKSKSLIVNLASSASFQAIPSLQVYAATKVFDRFFSEALRSELKNTGIEVLTVCPMYVQTSMVNNTEASWRSGVTTCSQYVDYLIDCMSSKKPKGLIYGPPHHTATAVISQSLLGMISNTRLAYKFIDMY